MDPLANTCVVCFKRDVKTGFYLRGQPVYMIGWYMHVFGWPEEKATREQQKMWLDAGLPLPESQEITTVGVCLCQECADANPKGIEVGRYEVENAWAEIGYDQADLDLPEDVLVPLWVMELLDGSRRRKASEN